MPLLDWTIRVGDRVRARDGDVGTVSAVFEGPPRSIFRSSDRYMIVSDPGQPDLFIPFTEIVDLGDPIPNVLLKQHLEEIDGMQWTRDPRRPSMRVVPYQARPPKAPVKVYRLRNGELAIAPRPRTEPGAWEPGETAPRREPGRPLRIGDRFRPGAPIPAEGQYLCTVCGARQHTRQFRDRSPDGRLPSAHHPGALWELEDLRP